MASLTLQRTTNLLTRARAPTALLRTTTPTIPRASASAAAGVARFSTAPSRRADDHGSNFEPPSGWLWGVPPGTKPEKEGWEGIWYWGFYGSLGLAVVAYAFKPDSRLVIP